MPGPGAARGLLSVNAIVGALAGAGLVVVPAVFLGILGIQANATGEVLARLYGVELLGFNAATWLARAPGPVSRPIVVGHVVNESLTAVVLGAAAINGMGNLLVVGFALVSAAFAAGYALLLKARS